MSIRFSRITAMTNDKAAVFLVGGIPKSQDDLNSWTAFGSFVEGIKENEVITVKVETFVYGEEEPFDATPEEVAYIYMRIDRDAAFIERRARKVEDSEIIIWLKK